jgi:hypothetical protein
MLVGTNFARADLSGCAIYGSAAWDVELEGTIQTDLIITPDGHPPIRVDDLEVGQFLYLMLYNQKLRRVIDTITSKVVLILGRFTPERRRVLDALREELRKAGRGYVPVVFDFEKPERRDLTETVTLLAHMARFIIADITDPHSIPHELATIVPTLAVPVQPVILNTQQDYDLFSSLQKYSWVLPVHRYRDPESLVASLAEHVIRPAEIVADALIAQRTRSDGGP